MSLEVPEKVDRLVLEVQKPQKWISHTQKPILGHKKIPNPSNGSKVMGLYIFWKSPKFLKFFQNLKVS